MHCFAHSMPACPHQHFLTLQQRGEKKWIDNFIGRQLEFNVNIRDRFQRTALHWAAEMGHADVAEALVDYQIDPLAVECNGRWVGVTCVCVCVTPCVLRLHMCVCVHANACAGVDASSHHHTTLQNNSNPDYRI